MTPQLRSWLIAIAVVLGLTVITRLVLRFLGTQIGRLAARTRSTSDDLLVDLIQRVRTSVLLATFARIATLSLPLPENVHRFIHWAFIVACVYQAGVWGNGVIAYLIKRRQPGGANFDGGAATTLAAIGFGARIVLWSALLLIGLQNAGVNVSALLTGLGIGGVAVALAVQNILGDIFASVAIVLDRPFVLGDFIIVGDLMGTVEHIGLKTTRLRSLFGEQLVISNAEMLRGNIKNYRRMQERRVTFGFGVTYQTPRAAVAAIPATVRTAVEREHDVRFDRAHFKEFGESALIFEVVYYVLSPDFNRYMDIQQAINLELMERFEHAKIGFAYPTRTLLTADVRDATLTMASGGNGTSAAISAPSAPPAPPP